MDWRYGQHRGHLVGGYQHHDAGSNVEVTATYTADPNYVTPDRGYTARACGFDLDDDGTLGGTGDDDVGDGVTTDPDGDGTNEDIFYVDATDGNDSTGDGSANNPYKTVQKALDTADGPGDGAEDIVAIHGTFMETVTFMKDGLEGHYTRDSFQFPNNPAMLVGWDTDNDGEYPPYDLDDEAVFDGNVDPNHRPWAMRCYDKRNNLEIAHLSIRNYGSAAWSSGGAISLFNSGDANRHHLYVHDVEMYNINKAIPDASGRIVFSFWGGVRHYVAMINCLVDGYASYFCRGAPVPPSDHFRFQNITLKMHGIGGKETNHFSVGWKVWSASPAYMEIIDNVIDVQPDVWDANSRQVSVCPGVCTSGWIIRNNEFIDTLRALTLHPDAGPNFCQERPCHDIVFDRNIITQTYDGWMELVFPVDIEPGHDANATVKDATISNNFFYANANDPNIGWYAGIRSRAGNDAETQPGTITIVGNTFWGLEKNNWHGGDCYGILVKAERTYLQQNYVIKNNIFNRMHGTSTNFNISVPHAPSNWVANGNVYDANGAWTWNGTKYTTLAGWQSASGEDANSVTGYPLFVDDANGDLHLDPNDTVAQGGGVDISSITDHDYDGDTRDANTKTAGADVP